jgi:hypothetical protein
MTSVEMTSRIFMTEDAKPKRKIEPKPIMLDPNPKATMKAVAGADHDEWNLRQANLVLAALPGKRDDEANTAVVAGIVDMKPADPIEGILIGQIIAANEAALKMYRLAWLNSAKYFQAHTKYLQLADKASRTVTLLTERLDQHRGRGQQQITVKYVTVNADQAVVTDQIVSRKARDASTATLLTSGTEKPMEILEPTHTEAVPVRTK